MLRSLLPCTVLVVTLGCAQGSSPHGAVAPSADLPALGPGGISADAVHSLPRGVRITVHGRETYDGNYAGQDSSTLWLANGPAIRKTEIVEVFRGNAYSSGNPRSQVKPITGGTLLLFGLIHTVVGIAFLADYAGHPHSSGGCSFLCIDLSPAELGLGITSTAIGGTLLVVGGVLVGTD